MCHYYALKTLGINHTRDSKGLGSSSNPLPRLKLTRSQVWNGLTQADTGGQDLGWPLLKQHFSNADFSPSNQMSHTLKKILK